MAGVVATRGGPVYTAININHILASNGGDDGFAELVDLVGKNPPKVEAPPSTSSTSTPTPPPPAHPSHLKYGSLVLMIFQSTAFVLMLRYSRLITTERYFLSVAVVLSELSKIICAFAVLVYQGGLDGAMAEVRRDTLGKPWDTLKVAVPAVAFAVQNNLNFYGISNLSAPVFFVTNQLKVFTTALFAMALLGKVLSIRKWMALFLLFVGVSLVQLDSLWTAAPPTPPSSNLPSNDSNGGELHHDSGTNNVYLGAIAVLAATMMSGFSSIYFEKIMKGSAVSMWTRNIQLALFSIIFGSIIAFVNDGEEIARKGVFYGWSSFVSFVVFVQAVGGLLVAVVIMYADNILKGFALSVSTILSSAISMFIHDFTLSVYFTLGASLVFFSLYLYEDAPDSNLSQK